MLNIKRIDHVLTTTVYSMTDTVPLIHLVRHRQLKFLGHILRMSKEEPARRYYALYIPTIGKRRPGRPRTSYLNYVQRLLGDNEGAMQEQQIAAFADDCHAWRNRVVACSAADGWWWLLGSKGLLQPTFNATLPRANRTLIEHVIFAHSAPGRTRTRTINTTKLERFIVRDLTDWANEIYNLVTTTRKAPASWLQPDCNLDAHPVGRG